MPNMWIIGVVFVTAGRITWNTSGRIDTILAGLYDNNNWHCWGDVHRLCVMECWCQSQSGIFL